MDQLKNKIEELRRTKSQISMALDDLYAKQREVDRALHEAESLMRSLHGLSLPIAPPEAEESETYLLG